ncbi:MAG: DNA-3-methyladenine glycosylase I [Chloroflexota bacterium]|nr:DNA-3-methyladenine glycosylase I [Chloroflexota bacterium]MDE2960794.1 DNA-3-methyladenine glycosylase I [Chloroflexota bacterium]
MTTPQERQHPDAPEQIEPQSLNDYLEVMTKAVFQSGMSWKVVNTKWPGFQAGFQGFDVAVVAAMDESAIDTLAADPAIIRNRRKIVATVHNAQKLIELEEVYDGDIRNYLRSHGDLETTIKDVRKQFKYMGDIGTYYWLYVTGEDVPSWDEFCSRGH